jgi:hypothetical protein
MVEGGDSGIRESLDRFALYINETKSIDASNFGTRRQAAFAAMA